MIKRTTIEIDDDLLNRAKEALGEATARATVEEALRRAPPAPRLNANAEPRSSGAIWSS